MSDREKELERVLKYVAQKAERFLATSDALDEAKRGVTEASVEGRNLDALLEVVQSRTADRIYAREFLDCVVAEAWELMGGRTIELERVA